MRKFSFMLPIFLILILLLSSCEGAKKAKLEVQDRTEFVLNTIISVAVYESEEMTEGLWNDIYKPVREVDALVNRFNRDSELSKINEYAGKCEVEISKTTYDLLSFAKEKSQEVNGAFNITIGALTSLWNIGGEEARLPSEAEIRDGLAKMKLDKLLLRSEDNRYYAELKEEGMSLDLGAVAKGYAAELTKLKLRELGVQRALLDFGGNILILDELEPAKDWKIGLQSPFKERGEAFMYVVVGDETVVSSGDYERFSIINGVKYQHIINPFTGYPVDNDLSGVSVIEENSALADVYSTSLMVMGKEKAREFIEAKKLEAILFYKDGSHEVFLKENRENGTL